MIDRIPRRLVSRATSETPVVGRLAPAGKNDDALPRERALDDVLHALGLSLDRDLLDS